MPVLPLFNKRKIMARIQFDKKLKLSKKATARLDQCNEIITYYQSLNMKLTLRQLYYQLVTKNYIPNNDKEYDKLGVVLMKGRMAGYVDWDAIVDRTRVPRNLHRTDGVEAAITDAADTYIRDRMQGQNNYVELWVEKDALSEVLSVKSQHYTINLMVNRGYSSTTAMKHSFERFRRALESGQAVQLLYLGDHDPSGLDMVRDIHERLFFMLGNKPGPKITNLAYKYDEELDLYGKYCMDSRAVDPEDGTFDEVRAYILEKFAVHHVGLTSEQIAEHNPPPNPVKLTDTRANWYLEKYGETCWEVDALNPEILHELIETNIQAQLDMDVFAAQLEREAKEIEELKTLPSIKADYPVKIKELEDERKRRTEAAAAVKKFKVPAKLKDQMAPLLAKLLKNLE